VPKEILENSKIFPYFSGALGAIDGMHIACCPSAKEWQLSQNHKGSISQNCLVYCSFDLQFQYVLSGWDGLTSNSTLYNNAQLTDLYIPEEKYYFADAGFGICHTLLVPY